MSEKTQLNPESEIKEKIDVPRKFNVVFHNDDYTPMDFVIEVLVVIFNKQTPEALALTETVHLKGKAIVAQYPKNVAQMKVKQVLEAAKANEFPLKCTMEAN